MQTISVNPLYDEIELILTDTFNQLRLGELVTGYQLVTRLEEKGIFKEKTAKPHYKLGAISRVIRRGRKSNKFRDIVKVNVREYKPDGNFRNNVAYSKRGGEDDANTDRIAT